MDVKQAFAELGLTLHATQADAKAAYRTLAMRWHPDVNAGAETNSRMKAINVAYALVCRHLHAGEKAAPRAATASSSQTGAVHKGANACRPDAGFFEFDRKSGFQTAASRNAQAPAELVQRTVRVSLFEAAFGCIKRVTGMQPDTCPRCAGSGEFPGTWTLGSKCMQCSGRGAVSGHGGSPCAACQGSGIFKPAPPDCNACKGTGKTERPAWMVDVHIHGGTLDGAEVQNQDVRVRCSVGEVPRTFKLRVEIEKHPLFQLQQDCLSVSVPVGFWRWSLGGDVTVPTLDGSVRVSLPARPAAMLLADQGWPEAGAPHRRKPLHVLPRLVYPEQLSEHERCLLQMLDEQDKLPEVEGWNRHVQAWLESSPQDSA